MTETRYAIFLLDEDGLIKTWNAEAEYVKGYKAEEIIGQHFSIFYPLDRVATGYPQAELAWAAEHGFYLDEGWRIRKDGTRFWAHVLIAAQRDAQGTLTGFIKVTRVDNPPTEAP